MSVDLNFSTNPFQKSSNDVDNSDNSKVQKMKKELQEKRAEAASILDTYRENFQLSKKDYEESLSIFKEKRIAMNNINENDENYDEVKNEFLESKKTYQKSRSERDLRLQLLQYRTDNYVDVNKVSILDIA